MSVAKFSTPCIIKKITGNSLYGEPLYGAGVNTKCTVMKLLKSRTTTTVRTDSAGSRGHADERTLDAYLLMSIKDNIELDDMISVANVSLRVASINPIFDICGNFDHVEVRGDIE